LNIPKKASFVDATDTIGAESRNANKNSTLKVKVRANNSNFVAK